MIKTFLIYAIAFYPTIDGQRTQLDAEAEIPYWLGVSVPPPSIVDCEAYQGGELLFNLDDFGGTDRYLARITLPDPVLFYQDGEYLGRIVPEPATLLILTGLLVTRMLYVQNRHAHRR